MAGASDFLLRSGHVHFFWLQVMLLLVVDWLPDGVVVNVMV